MLEFSSNPKKPFSFFNQNMICFQLRRKSTLSNTDVEIEDQADDRNERQLAGSVGFQMYRTFFKAARSSIYVMVVFVLFIAAQFAKSGADYFVSQW